MTVPPSPSTTILLVPAAFFGMVLGVGGLGSAWRIASRLWGVPVWIGEALVLAATGLWLLWLGLFTTKWIVAPFAGRKEASDPAIGFSLGLLPMATLLVSVLVRPYAAGIAEIIFAAGLLAGIAFAVWVMGGAWCGGRSLSATTPLMYLSPVGAGFLGAQGAAAFGYPDLALLLWGAGAISWLIIEAAVLQRLMAEAMPVAMRASVGIQLAPPGVGCMTYLAITPGPPDKLALFMLGYAMLQALILLRLAPWLREQPFGPGAWAYTFGVAALAVSMLAIAERGSGGVIAGLAGPMFVLANVLIGWIAARTVQLALAGRLFPKPVP